MSNESKAREQASSEAPIKGGLRLRYSGAQQSLHWLTALLMFAVLPVAWVLVSVVEESKPFFFWMDVHESVGLAIFGITGVRILWRLLDPPPPHVSTLAPWLRRASRVVHWGLLFALIAMPTSGYLWTTGHGHDVAHFHLLRFPRIAFNYRPLGDFFETVHVYGQWVVYGLLVLHIGGVCHHVFVRRDGLLERMLPRQADAATNSVGSVKRMRRPE